MFTISEALSFSKQQLRNGESPNIDSQLLLAHVLSCSTSYLYTWPEKALTQKQQTELLALLELRKRGHPIAHLTGQRGFWTLNLQINKHTLIPRPDTELLVEKALEKITDDIWVSDLGTGSGAIVLALASERPQTHFFACDYSPQALNIAMANAKQNQIDNVCFWRGDWLAAIASNSLDIIVSNPPYIEQDDPHMQQGDVKFEPKQALVSGCDGLDDVRLIVEQAAICLRQQGWLLLEHGHQQAQSVAAIMQGQGFNNVTSYQDYGGNDRVTIGQLTL